MTRQSVGAIIQRVRALAVLSCLAFLAACGGGGGGDTPPPPPETELSFLNSSEFQKVLFAVPAEASVRTAAAVAAGTVRIHYNRTDGAYTNWKLYAWNAPGEALGGWPGKASTGTDSYGVYWDIPVTAEKFNFIIHDGTTREPSGWSGANADQQQEWVLSGGNEVWKLSGDKTNYTANPLSSGPKDVTKVKVHYKRYDNDYANWGVHIWASSGLDVAGLPGVTIDSWDNPVGFDAFPGYAAGAGEVVFEIPVLNPKDDAARKTLEFIIHGKAPNQSNKDGRNDNIVVSFAAMTVTDKVGEVWLVQDDPSTYYAKPDTRSASSKDAKAYWLTKSLIQWPRVDSTNVFKLYYSKNAQIVAKKDAAVAGADGFIALTAGGTVPSDVATRFKFVPAGVVLSVGAGDMAKLPELLTKQVVLVQEDTTGKVQNATTAQIAGALDDLYAAAGDLSDLGVTVAGGNTTFKVWAPTAQQVKLGLYDTSGGPGVSIDAMTFEPATGVWSLTKTGDLSGKYYVFVADVFVRGVGIVRNRVTDPYSISLTTDSKRSYIADLNAASLKPAEWDTVPAPVLAAQEDMSIYELHVRDFSVSDATVPEAHRGKYLGFTAENSNGMKHLKALAAAGLTDVHLLPVFDLATVPESGCVTPSITSSNDSTAAATAINAVKDADCFNWGYDPFHYTAPEGSYATDAADGAKRILEFRQMVTALHKAGLRVGMDVVYNHTSASGQTAKSVLDRIVPGYYHRYNTSGAIEKSTCCDNTATENLMMAKLMIDSVKTWATQYKIDSFRFDLMGHQPRAAMEKLKQEVDAATEKDVFLLGEGWNFGEVASGARFVQASQLSLNGSGIGTFSDRARDRIRGGGCCDSNEAFRAQGFVTGLFYDQNDAATGHTVESLMDHADMVRVGLAGSLRSYAFETRSGAVKKAEEIQYGSDPAGYVTDPQEVVNYYENHDNSTFWDAQVAKLPKGTSLDDRVRVQNLAAALNAFSQGIAYFHAGTDVLRSKSFEYDSYNSGDWFNKLDWTYEKNNFGVGKPVKGHDTLASLFMSAGEVSKYTPTKAHIEQSAAMFRDLLAIRKSSQLFRLRTADEVKKCLKFYNTGASQVATVIAGHLNGTECATGAGFKQVMYFVNVDKVAHDITIDAQKSMSYTLHPVHAAAGAADTRAKTATYDNASGKFSIPARTAVVFVSDVPAAAVASPVKVTFKVTATTDPGQVIYIVGNQPEIGSWSATASDSRKCTAGASSVWSCEITWPTPGLAIEYKFQKFTSGGSLVKWDDTAPNRAYVIPSADAQVDSGTFQ